MTNRFHKSFLKSASCSEPHLQHVSSPLPFKASLEHSPYDPHPSVPTHYTIIAPIRSRTPHLSRRASSPHTVSLYTATCRLLVSTPCEKTPSTRQLTKSSSTQPQRQLHPSPARRHY